MSLAPENRGTTTCGSRFRLDHDHVPGFASIAEALEAVEPRLRGLSPGEAPLAVQRDAEPHNGLAAIGAEIWDPDGWHALAADVSEAELQQ